MKKSRWIKTLIMVFVLILVLGYLIPASATNGSFEVTVKVTGFDGTTPLGNVYIDMFGTTMNTNRRGECTFKLKNVSNSESYSFRVYDKSSGQTYGDGTITIDRAAETNIMARPSGGPGQFGIQLYFNDNTSFFFIQSQIDQANFWSVDFLDFDEAFADPPSAPEPQPESFEEPHPDFQEPPPGEEPPQEFMEDPDMHMEEPPLGDFFEEPRPEHFNESFWNRIDPLMAALVGAVLVLIILVIILIARNAKQKKDKKE